MTWPIDHLVTMDADEVSRGLAGQGLPGVTFLFWDPRKPGYVSWREAHEAERRQVLEAIARSAN